MEINWRQALHFPGFYLAADTQYQLHAPFAFELARAVLEDRRWYYAFDDIEAIRARMLRSKVSLGLIDYSSTPAGRQPLARQVPLARVARRSSSSPRQGRWLFRLAQLLQARQILELGTSVGIGAMYLASGARSAQLVSLEGSPDYTHVAATNLEILGLQKNCTLLNGPFQQSLDQALRRHDPWDLIFFDGHHQEAATLAYFEQCLPHLSATGVAVFDDIYWSAEMLAAWKKIQAKPQVTLSIDLFDLGLVFINPELKSGQHLKLVPTRWKPWKMAELR